MTQIPPDKDPIQRVLSDGFDDIPPEIAARARRQLDGLREKMEARENRRPQTASWGSDRLAWLRRLLVPVAALVLIGVLAAMIGSEIASRKVYAQAVRRIREARTLQVAMSSQFEGAPEMKMQIAFRNDGMMRLELPGGVVSLMDMRAMKTYTADHQHKIIIETAISNLPEDPQKGRDPAREIERLRRLPERASEELGEKTIGGRRALGYRVAENGEIDEVWIDADTRDLLRIDASSTAYPSIRTTMTDFRFDAALGADFFSTATPAGYRRQTIDLNLANPSAEDLTGFLQLLVRFTPDGTYPPSLVPSEVQKLVTSRAGKQSTAKSATESTSAGAGAAAPAPLDSDAIRKKTAEAGALSARAILFIMSMKPENDWHYVGEGVKPGDAKTPIAWWKPAGSVNYKVIYGDLSVREEPREAIPTAK